MPRQQNTGNKPRNLDVNRKPWEGSHTTATGKASQAPLSTGGGRYSTSAVLGSQAPSAAGGGRYSASAAVGSKYSTSAAFGGGTPSTASAAGGDPRVAAIALLQEEMREKKNALEALMRGMGKPSSLHPDNISDNISDADSDDTAPTRPLRRSVEHIKAGRSVAADAAATCEVTISYDVLKSRSFEVKIRLC